jgi:polysaccharide pyruvyl transferase WcaK-like protein
MRAALVFGYYGKDNQGDDAMLQVIASQFKKLGVKTIALSYNPSKTKKRFGIEAVSHETGLEKLDYDFFVLGGGTQIQDYRVGGFEKLVRFYRKAKKPGVKTCLLCIGATRLKTRKGKRLARELCSSSDLIIMRDSQGKAELKKAGVRKQIHVSADLTFSMPFPKKGPKRKAILFCPIPFHEIYEQAPKKDRALAKKLAAAIDLIAGETNAKVSVLPFFRKYDTVFCRRILQHVESRKVKLVPYKALGLGLTKTFEKFDLVVGMRFHSLVFSAFVGKPFVAVAFTAKTKNLVKSLSWKSFAVSQGFEAKELAKKAILLYKAGSRREKKVLAERKRLAKKSKKAFALFRKKFLS